MIFKNYVNQGLLGDFDGKKIKNIFVLGFPKSIWRGGETKRLRKVKKNQVWVSLRFFLANRNKTGGV